MPIKAVFTSPDSRPNLLNAFFFFGISQNRTIIALQSQLETCLFTQILRLAEKTEVSAFSLSIVMFISENHFTFVLERIKIIL